MTLEPYLSFHGNCREAFEFYAAVLGGKIEAMLTAAEAPGGADLAPECRYGIMHARLNLNGRALLASDMPSGQTSPMQGIHLSLAVATVQEAERIYAALSEGGKIAMPLGETFWSPRFAMFTDRFGTPWMINCEAQ